MVSLCIDIGNTFIKAAVFSNGQMLSFQTLQSENLISLIEHQQIQNVIISSVSSVPEKIIEILQEKKTPFLLLDHNTSLPITNNYETKETLGKDRLAAVVGANYLHPGSDLLVIDAGTAITYDFIDANGNYLGGNISPGIQMRFKALNHFTSKLPLVEMKDQFQLFGKNTNDAILTGVLQGILCETDGTIAAFKKLYPGLKVLFTGGDAKFFDYKLKNAIFVVSNLVMIGLNRILEYNAQNL